MDSEIPKFLMSRRYISATIVSIVLFSVLFLLTYRPFSLAVWFSVDDTVSILFTLLFYITSVVIMILSRWMMYILQDRYLITKARYLCWIMVENLLITLLYTYVTYDYFTPVGVSVFDVGVRAFFCVTTMLIIPNAIISFYAAYRSKCEDLEAVQYELSRVSEEYRRLESRSEVERRVSEMIPVKEKLALSPKMVQLYDNGGTLRLTINLDSLYYLESEDNYMKVYYKHNGKLSSYMLRCKTSSVESSLEGSIMVRCHRSYIVNISKIRFIGKEHRVNFIVMDDEGIKRIPVSKRYYDSLLSSLNTIHPQRSVDAEAPFMLHQEG